MKTFARLMAVTVALSAGLFFAGCTTTVSTAPRQQPVADFTVVESSTAKELTPEQLAEIRQAVLTYLQKEGLTDGRRYYVKVLLPTENPDDEPQWAIVRIGNSPIRNYTVIAAYPGADDYYPYDYFRYGYYTPGYAGYSPYGYYEPYDHYYYGGYGRSAPPRAHPKSDKPDHPSGTHTRWDHTPRTDSDQPRPPEHPPRATGADRRNRDRDNDHDRKHTDVRPTPARSSDNNSPRNSTPPESRPSPAPSYAAPSTEAPHREPAQTRSDRHELPENER